MNYIALQEIQHILHIFSKALKFKSLFPPSEKELRWEERREELNLPPMVTGTHYALDEEGFPMHHNGKYVSS